MEGIRPRKHECQLPTANCSTLKWSAYYSELLSLFSPHRWLILTLMSWQDHCSLSKSLWSLSSSSEKVRRSNKQWWIVILEIKGHSHLSFWATVKNGEGNIKNSIIHLKKTSVSSPKNSIDKAQPHWNWKKGKHSRRNHYIIILSPNCALLNPKPRDLSGWTIEGIPIRKKSGVA